MAVKYQILFNDVDGNPCKVSFDFANWDGPFKNIEASGDPVTISYNGSRENLFQQVVTSKAVIKVIAQQDFVNDTRDVDDREVSVTIETPSNKWVGYLISYQRAETFDSGNYDLEMTCVDPFSYLKDTTNKLLSDTLKMGKLSLSDIVTSITGLPISVNIGYTPLTKEGNPVIGNLFDNVYILIETFFDNGLLMSGFDIISKICDLFNCTAFVENGVVNFRQPRKLINQDQKQVGFIGDMPDCFLIGDNEQITRTKGIIQIGVSHEYGDIGGNIIPNNFFYYYNPSAVSGGEFTKWTYDTASINTVTRNEIQREGSNGIFIHGTADASHGEIIESTWANRHDFMVGLSEFTSNITQEDPLLNNTYYFRLKYRYHRYALTRTIDPIKYAFRIFAVFQDGSQYTFHYDGNGGRKEQGGEWTTNSDPLTLIPLITFPLEATGNESTFELNINCTAGEKGFPVDKGDYQLMVVLYPISSGTTNQNIPDNVIPNTINITEVSITPDIYTMPDFEINRDNNPARTRVESALFMADQTHILSKRKFKTVNDDVEVVAGVKISEVPDAIAGNPKHYTMNRLNGVLMLVDNTSIEQFRDIDSTDDKLVTLNAKDRMYFLRSPRNQITVDIRSAHLKFSDVLSFPGYIEGKYVQMESEYRVAECEHSVTVQELSGSDDVTDIIENFLSSE